MRYSSIQKCVLNSSNEYHSECNTHLIAKLLATSKSSHWNLSRFLISAFAHHRLIQDKATSFENHLRVDKSIDSRYRLSLFKSSTDLYI